MSFLDIFKPLIGPIIEPFLKLIPDPNARAQAQEQMELALIAAGTQAMGAQAEINKAEASSPSVFVAGWRPFIGWVCGVGIGWKFIVAPIVIWVATFAQVDVSHMPQIDTGELMSLVVAMLGLAGYRTYERTQGVALNNLK